MPDDVAVAVEQRTAGVAGVDRGVELDQAGHHRARVRQLERAVEAGHDAGAQGAVRGRTGCRRRTPRCRCACAAGLPSVAGTTGRAACRASRTAMSFASSWLAIVAPARRPVGERDLDVRRPVDDVERREDLAGVGDDDAAAEAAGGRAGVGGRRGVGPGVGLDQDERRLDRVEHELRARRPGRLRREHVVDGVDDLALRDAGFGREQRGVEGDAEERGEDAGQERRGATEPGDRPPAPARVSGGSARGGGSSRSVIGSTDSVDSFRCGTDPMAVAAPMVDHEPESRLRTALRPGAGRRSSLAPGSSTARRRFGGRLGRALAAVSASSGDRRVQRASASDDVPRHEQRPPPDRDPDEPTAAHARTGRDSRSRRGAARRAR